MAYYKRPEEDTPEYYYEKGLDFIKVNRPKEANKMWKIAAVHGHASSLYNLFLLNGNGSVSPYNIDYAAECLYNSASFGHEKAEKQVSLLEAADRGGFGFDNIARLAGQSQTLTGGKLQVSLDSLHTVCACRFVKNLCNIFDSFNEVISYELDCASASEESYVHNFIKRTGIKEDFYRGGEYLLKEGGPADKITDGLNQLAVAMAENGVTPDIIAFQRCTIVGYLIINSEFGCDSSQLYGLDKFFI